MRVEDNKDRIIKDFCTETAKAKANNKKLCNCSSAKPGRIELDTKAHELGCRLRKRIGRYAFDTSVVPSEIKDGASLGVAIASEEEA